MSRPLLQLVELIVRLRSVSPDRIDAVCSFLEAGPEDFSSVQTSSIVSKIGPSADHRQSLSNAVEHARGISGLSTHEFSSWLRTAVLASEQASSEQKVELVGTGPSPVHSDFRSSSYRLLELIGAARETIWIASYTVGNPRELQTRLRGAIAAGVRISFLCERAEDCNGNPEYLTGWQYLDPDVLRGINFYCWPKEKRTFTDANRIPLMHVKAVVVDRTTALVTSANLTEAANARNMEFGVVVNGGSTASQIHDRLETMRTSGLIVEFDPLGA